MDQGCILISAEVADELRDVLSRPKFDRYVSPEERDLFLATLIREALLVEITDSVEACRDPKDDKYLALASTGSASCIVSSDQDLLVLGEYAGVPIFTPTQFLAFLRHR